MRRKDYEELNASISKLADLINWNQRDYSAYLKGIKNRIENIESHIANNDTLVNGRLDRIEKEIEALKNPPVPMTRQDILLAQLDNLKNASKACSKAELAQITHAIISISTELSRLEQEDNHEH